MPCKQPVVGSIPIRSTIYSMRTFVTEGGVKPHPVRVVPMRRE
jgi:hypothetical protein